VARGRGTDLAAQDVVVTLTDGDGRLWRGALAAGSLVSKRDGRLWSYARPEGGAGDFERAKLELSRDGRTLRYALRATGDQRVLVAGPGSARLRIGDTCLLDPADTCTTKRGKGACR
jgi:hypothetical protein